LHLSTIHAAAAQREDAVLHRRHGADFEDYNHRVPSFWPRGLAHQVPERLEIRPRVL
jgi:protein-S-isoprenylcysteine O-methyltransferase Ste14